VVADSHKRACKNEEFKSRTVNRFPKIKEAYIVKLKMIFVNHYFRPYETPKNAENIFKKTFYAETNRALLNIRFMSL
jgi:hypothetical protein